MAESIGRLNLDTEIRRISNQPKLGIIAGSGPDAGLDLWWKLLHTRRVQLNRKYRGDLDAPDVRIHSVPLLGLSMDMERYADVVWTELCSVAEQMASDCDAYTIACNTLHYFSNRLGKISGGRFISVQDVVREELIARGRKKFALLGASPVMSLGKWSPYSELQSDFEIETIDGRIVDELIYSIKIAGDSTPELSSRLMEIVNGLNSELIVLGCTELPLVKPFPTHHVFLDVTSLLASALLRTK